MLRPEQIGLPLDFTIRGRSHRNRCGLRAGVPRRFPACLWRRGTEPRSGAEPARMDRSVSSEASTFHGHTHHGQYSHYCSQSPLDGFHSDMSQTLNQATVRMESANRQQGKNIEQRLKSVEDKIDRRLHQVEVLHEQLASSTEELHSQCQSLWEENQDLRGTVNSLINKLDYVENQSRRNNLLFCCWRLRACEGWSRILGGIRDEGTRCCPRGHRPTVVMQIERVHRSGKPIVVTFLSKDVSALECTETERLR